MTITDYLNAKMQEIWDDMPIIGQISYMTFGIYIEKDGSLMWSAHPTMRFHETGIYKTSQLEAVLALQSVHRHHIENIVEDAEGLIERLIDDNWPAIQTFNDLVETVRHDEEEYVKAMIDDLPTSKINPLC